MKVTLRLFSIGFASIAIILIFQAMGSQEWVMRDGVLISGACFASALLMLKSLDGACPRPDDQDRWE
ncbi:hypothetical protein [Sulfidibacter corallicola]|uniref:Uncharacterized protein n=1 Tax=Sulfidibacter corallicola TaxID=2818388 RepID=A0A8A4TH80_SULCO|nr:hypothetical protein [Sulfidibacter corallicola]QTD48867.1 hypothetical protein J3U87_25065 [Sulfidibacter corallicola]